MPASAGRGTAVAARRAARGAALLDPPAATPARPTAGWSATPGLSHRPLAGADRPAGAAPTPSAWRCGSAHVARGLARARRLRVGLAASRARARWTCGRCGTRCCWACWPRWRSPARDAPARLLRGVRAGLPRPAAPRAGRIAGLDHAARLYRPRADVPEARTAAPFRCRRARI